MSAVRKVHVIFKTHLDVGFTDYAENVVRNYMESYIPAAIKLAREMRQAGGDRFIWTTGSWLIHAYLRQAAPAEKRAMEEAIRAGDIAWHGLPFTTHTELLDPFLLQYGLRLSLDLDRYYGRETIAAKMTDVPGHTIGLVPFMDAAGLRFLHIGVNPACTAPDVPDVFRWRHPGGAEVVVMYHKGSYGSTMLVPGMDEAIAFAHTGDNCGPQSADAIRQSFAELRARYPGAEVVASTLDDYARALLRIADRLPVVEAEIGDTWIHGAASDPWKIAAYRALCRTRARWLLENPLLDHCDWFQAFSERLLFIPEHTWGLDEKTHLGDYRNYARADFAAAMAADAVPDDTVPAGQPWGKFRCQSHPPRYSTFAASWQEQRDYLHQAIEALHSDYRHQAQIAFDSATAARAPRDGYAPMPKWDEPRFPGHLYVRFDPATGALIAFEDGRTGRKWADIRHPLGLVRYQTFAQADYDRFVAQYSINMEHAWASDWAIPDFAKPGMAATGAESRLWTPTLTGLYERRDANDQYYLATLAMPDEAVTRYGAPAEVEVEYVFPAGVSAVSVTVQWFGKAASRLPEALWCSFTPRCPAPRAWLMEKLGAFVSPLDVVKHGNRRLHALDHGLVYTDESDQLTLATLDAPLVSAGNPALLDFDQKQPNLKHGWHFCLHNNVWGSNFPMWYGEDGVARFVLNVAALPEEEG